VPSPIHVIQDLKDPRTYFLSPSSDAGDHDTTSAASSSNDHGKQTFPESANSRAPSWGTSSQDLQPGRSYDRSRFPQTPSTAGLTANTAQQMVKTPLAATMVRDVSRAKSSGEYHAGDGSANDLAQQSSMVPPSKRDLMEAQTATSDGSARSPEQGERRPSGSSGFSDMQEAINTLPLNIPSVHAGSPPPYEVSVNSQPPSELSNTPASLTFPATIQSAARTSVSGIVERPQRGVSSTWSPARRLSTVGGPRPKPPTVPRSPGLSRLKYSSGSTSASTFSSRGQKANTSIFSTYPTPLFVTPESRWKGHTLDAAMWTFSSETLQETVAQAIRESASESRIRLLRPEILDEEIPAEIRNLESKQETIQAEYRYLCHKRSYLLRELSMQSDTHLSAPINNSSLENMARELRVSWPEIPSVGVFLTAVIVI
jgi:hypothetical protein